MEALLTKEEILRESILQAAQRLFQQYGLRKVTMDDVARAIGKGKSSLYYYYKDKEEIFEAVLGREVASVIEHIVQAVAEAPTAAAKLEAFVLTKLRMLRQKAALYTLIQRDIYQYYSLDFAAKLRQSYQASEVAVITQILAYGIATNEFQPLVEPTTSHIANVLVISIYGFEQEVLLEDCLPALEPEVKLLVQLLVRGLAT